MREFKDINRRYRDQLIKVKVGTHVSNCCDELMNRSRCPTWRTTTWRNMRKPLTSKHMHRAAPLIVLTGDAALS